MEPAAVWAGDGFALTVIDEANVQATGDLLRVDVADGTRWFDVKWIDAMNQQPEIYAWQTGLCDRARWDSPGIPVEGTMTMGGSCDIKGRRHFIIAAFEVYGDRELMTMYVADTSRVTLEDAWVDAFRTAFSLTSGSVPLATVTSDDVRHTMRQAVADGKVGQEPIPGGGELTKHVSERLSEVWKQRRANPPPPTLVVKP